MSAIEDILRAASEAGASDVHMMVDAPPMIRINGKLERMNYPELSEADNLDSILYMMNETQRQRFEEKGEYDVSFSVPGCGRVRVSAYKQNGTSALAVRILKKEIPNLDELEADGQLTALCMQEKGLVLVTGAAGSGKTTTIASMLERINVTQSKLIVTMEHPIEYLHNQKLSLINQREIGTDTEGYAVGMNALRRLDVDVIALDAIPDYGTLGEVLDAVEAGRLVLAELQADHISGAVDRLTGLCPVEERALFKARIARIPLAVTEQRLVPGSRGQRRAEFHILKNKLVQENGI